MDSLQIRTSSHGFLLKDTGSFDCVSARPGMRESRTKIDRFLRQCLSRASSHRGITCRSRVIYLSLLLCSTGSPSKPSQSSGHKTGACAAAAPAKTTPDAKAKGASAAKEPVPSPSTEPKASGPPNKPSYQARLGLARVLTRKGGDNITESHKLYEEVIDMAPEFHDAYIELADSLVKCDPLKAVDIYSKYPFKEPLTFDDAYIYGEIVRLLMKQEKYDDTRLGPSLISLGKVLGLSVIEKYVEALDKTFKYSKLLMEVYAGVHGKNVDDPDLKQFFKFKCWI